MNNWLIQEQQKRNHNKTSAEYNYRMLWNYQKSQEISEKTIFNDAELFHFIPKIA